MSYLTLLDYAISHTRDVLAGRSFKFYMRIISGVSLRNDAKPQDKKVMEEDEIWQLALETFWRVWLYLKCD